jgi:hypothetical protein
MGWIKKGLIYCPNGSSDWAKTSFMTPTPMLAHNGAIRVYGGMRDAKGISRIGFIDVLGDNPKVILNVSSHPVLDIGAPGCFDDNGVILGDIVDLGSEIRMYYIGFQLARNVKFLAFTGLAISKDGGESFIRYRETPIMDRCAGAPHIRAIHSVIYEGGSFKVWHAIGKGTGWKEIGGRVYPAYNIWHTNSVDGLNFDKDQTLCIDTESTEYRIGRPRVYRTSDGYEMYYTRDFIERNYIAGYARSSDGTHWSRYDNNFPITKSLSGWDSQMTCYPALFCYKEKKYMFYNGNNFGETGVGYAQFEFN